MYAKLPRQGMYCCFLVLFVVHVSYTPLLHTQTQIFSRLGMPSSALLSAYAYYDATALDGSGKQLDYHSYGACVSEVLIDVLTGILLWFAVGYAE